MSRVLAFNSAGTADGQIIHRGEEVPASEVERLDALGALVPEGQTLDEHLDRKLDVYRGSRGDQEALRRANEASGIVDVSGQSDIPLTDRIKNGLTVEETVALAGDDPERAQAVLAAENEASGGEPRKGVEDALSKIIDGK